MRVLLVLLLLLTACGFKTRRLADGGTSSAAGCNQTFSDGNQVYEPPATAPFANIAALQFSKGGDLFVLNVTATASWVTQLGPQPENAFVRTYGRDVLHLAHGLAVDPDASVWVTDYDELRDALPRLLHFSETGALLATVDLQANEVGGVAVASDGTLWLAVGKLGHYSRTGERLGLYADKFPLVAHYTGLAFDKSGLLWATDLNERTVEQFDTMGNRLANFGGHGSGPAMFDGESDVHGAPTHVAVDAAGALYVNDPLASRIMKLSKQGSMLAEFGFGGSQSIYAIAIDPQTGVVHVGRGNAIDLICPL